VFAGGSPLFREGWPRKTTGEKYDARRKAVTLFIHLMRAQEKEFRATILKKWRRTLRRKTASHLIICGGSMSLLYSVSEARRDVRGTTPKKQVFSSPTTAFPVRGRRFTLLTFAEVGGFSRF